MTQETNRGANWTDPQTGEACFVSLGQPEMCAACGKHISKHFGGLEYRCQSRPEPSREGEGDRKGYYGNGLQPWDLFKAQGIAIPFAVGCIIKYVSRYNLKNGLDDLIKARWYLDRLIELVNR